MLKIGALQNYARPYMVLPPGQKNKIFTTTEYLSRFPHASNAEFLLSLKLLKSSFKMICFELYY